MIKYLPIKVGVKCTYRKSSSKWWWDTYMKDGEEYEIIKIERTKRKGLKRYSSKITNIIVGPLDKLKDGTWGFFISKDKGLKIHSSTFARMFGEIPVLGVNDKVKIL